MYVIALFKQKLGEVGAVLASHTGDQSSLSGSVRHKNPATPVDLEISTGKGRVHGPLSPVPQSGNGALTGAAAPVQPGRRCSYSRYQSTNLGMPTSTEVAGVKPRSRWAASRSGEVSGTWPACSGCRRLLVPRAP